MANFTVTVEGLAGVVANFDLGSSVRRKASQAVNKTAQRARTASARAIAEQVNFPGNYLTGKDGRLRISKYSTPDDLEAVITGRDRPTSLARFATAPTPNLKAPTVIVKPGKASHMRRAFLMKLRRGSTLTDTQFNLGLAIRLKTAERVFNKKVMVPVGDTGLYLLYGPSVAQVFKDVADKQSSDALKFLENEFERLMRLARG